MSDERAPGPTFALADMAFFDFESRGPVSIKDGTYRYASEAHAIMLAWAIGGGDVRVEVVRDFDQPLIWTDMPDELRAFQARVEAGSAVWAAWNAGFDRAIWNYATLDFPFMEPHHVIDVMAQATASGLPPDLDAAAKQSGSLLKDKAGSALIKLFCLPTSTATPQSHPNEWQQFTDYAGDDVKSMRSVFLATRQLPLAEWREYWTMEAINARGIGIDLAMARHAAVLADEDNIRSADALAQLTGGAVTRVNQVARMTRWLLERLPPEGRAILTKRVEEVDENGDVVKPAKHQLTRGRVERLIAFCSDVKVGKPAFANLIDVLRVLQIRLYGGSKTPAKFRKMLQGHIDGVLFGQYVFNGAAQTGRASSKGVQIHNLARDTVPDEVAAIDLLLAKSSYDDFATCGDATPVSRKLSLLIRPAFVPVGPENVFVWSDWSQIEARVLPWLAGSEQRLQIFRDVDADPSLPDLYTRSAADIAHIPVESVTKPLRQIGKVAELALGFGGGLGALQAMGAGYGVHISEDLGRAVVDQWRKANPWCVDFWDALWTAANRALELPGTLQQAGRIHYVYLRSYLGGSLLAVLPSGRCLTYRDIRYERVADLDDDDKVIGYSTQLRFARGHVRIKTWAGQLCENVVQAVAADILRGTLRRLEDAGHCVRAHTHDEVLLEVAQADAAAMSGQLHEFMCQGFDWSDGLPIRSEETVGWFYSKSERSHGL